tara:strand:- start:872 stop:1075 length:204 start_codon:yes stop_codon:yes gene_type:complete
METMFPSSTTLRKSGTTAFSGSAWHLARAQEISPPSFPRRLRRLLGLWITLRRRYDLDEYGGVSLSF